MGDRDSGLVAAKDTGRMRSIEIIPLTGIGEIAPGDDLPAILAAAIDRAGTRLADGDILVVTQKIVSKSEDRFVSLDTVVPGAEAVRLAG